MIGLEFLPLVIVLGLVSANEVVRRHPSGTFLVDRNSLRDWAKEKYNVDIQKETCAHCGKELNEEEVGRIFSHRNNAYIVCSDCNIYSNETIVEMKEGTGTVS